MTDSTILQAQITALITEFAWRIDHLGGEGVEDLFTEDGTYSLFGFDISGRVAIKQLYGHRRAQGERTSRHIFTNLHLDPFDGSDVATGVCVLTLHAADGPPPHRLAPLLVADYRDVYHRQSDGRWRFRSRGAQALFHRE